MSDVSHRKQEERSLRMHRLIAERYRRSPSEVVRFGLNNLARWRQTGVYCEDFVIWEDILNTGDRRILDILEGTGEEAVRLRQSSPFAGLISEEVRRQILASE